MTKQTKDDILSHFKSPAGITLGLNLIILIGNFIFASQLLPITNTINLLSQRVDTLEKTVDGQQNIIIPKGELDQRFTNIDNQLNDIKRSLDSAKLR